VGCDECSNGGDSADFYYFNTQVTVEVYSGSLIDQTKSQIDRYLKELDKAYRIADQNSVSYKFNNLAVGESFELPQGAKEVFEDCLNYYSVTQGAFNPAVYPLVELWQFSPNYPVENFRLPTQSEIAQIVDSGVLDYSSCFTIQDNVITKLTDAKIDFGGIIKGYAVDHVAKILKNNGHSDGYVNAGGSSLRLLNVDSLGIIHPRKNGQLLSVNTSLANVSVSTSGDYQKYYELEGKRYSHIIDSKNGKPCDTGVQSATIICPSGSYADAMSTALCLCEYSDSNSKLIKLCQNVLQTYPSAMIFVAVQKGEQKMLITNKTENADFTLFDQSYQIVNI
jgi:thiamine biosynthesis lipoprotein